MEVHHLYSHQDIGVHTMKGSYTHLCLSERREIYYLKHYKQCSVREIGRILKRSHSTISRELKRNSGCWCDQYYHNPAQLMADVRLRNRAIRDPLKNDITRQYVIRKLKDGWTPEIISGRLKLEESVDYVCHESIYQYIYKNARELRECLPRQHKKRHKKYPYRKYKTKITHKTSILDRPIEVDQRIQPGHWESDSIESKGRTAALNVLLERVTRLTHISKLKSKKSIDTKKAIIGRLEKHHYDFVRSITYDNGVENAMHQETNEELKCTSYFCQPYHSWEKGAVEQVNGLIRRYIPKGTNLENISNKELREIEYKLNSRPRKCLGYKTPIEVYNEICGALQS